MTGAEAARKLKGVIAFVKDRETVTPEELRDFLELAVGLRRTPSELSAKRAEAGRRGGLRSAEARAEANGSANPKHPPKQEAKQTTKQNPVLLEANVSKTPPVSSPPLHSPSSLPPEIPKEITVISEGPDRSRAHEASAEITTNISVPKNLTEALGESPSYRASLVMSDPMLADLLRAHQWPDIVELLTAWHVDHGGSGVPKIGIPSRDSGVRAMLELVGMGYMKSDLLRVSKHLAGSERFGDKKHPSILKPDVVAIALAELNEKPRGASEWAKGLVSSVERGGAPEPLGGALTRFAAGGVE